MSVVPPPIDARSASRIADEVQTLMSKFVRESRIRGELSQALIQIFARFGEIVIDRLNKAPEKNFLAFLDLLGVSIQPPQPSRVPLTFYLSTENAGFAVVPAGTQVAAPPGKGERDPIVFETERDLLVVAARLESLIQRDADRDRYVQYDSIVPQAPPPLAANSAANPEGKGESALPAYQAKLIPHMLYIGFAMYRYWPIYNRVELEFVLDQAPETPDPRVVQWEMCTSVLNDEVVETIPLLPAIDETYNLTKSGSVVFENLPQLEEIVIQGLANQWLRCRLRTPISQGSTAADGMVRMSHLPAVQRLTMLIRFERNDLRIDQAFANNVKLDLTKDFFPFGERPKFGDTLYLSNDEVFSNPDASVICEITLTNPATGGPDVPIKPVGARRTKLRWEFWDGTMWAELGTSDVAGIVDERPRAPEPPQFTDTTLALTASGRVGFNFSRHPMVLEINGISSYWVRVRIISGDYGEEAHTELDSEKGEYVIKDATFAPPSIHSISLSYRVNKSEKPRAILAFNDWVYQQLDPMIRFLPFVPASAGIPPILYFGFTLPVIPASTGAGTQPSRRVLQGKFPNRSISLYADLAEGQRQKTVAGYEPQVPTWEYWNGSAWTRWTVRDETLGLRRSALIRVLPPPDFAIKKEFGCERYWFRMRQFEPEFEPVLQRVILNTTTALQGITISGEVLGASNGQPNQEFRTTHAPVLQKQQLEVREPGVPSFIEQSKITAEEGDDAIRAAGANGATQPEVWVRWHEVPNFYGSGPRDRHYVLDRRTGQVRFGDGTSGLIPPVFAGNIRMTKYRTGGGSAGNKSAFSVNQVKTALPYVDRVVNWREASGGSEEESSEALLQRGPRILRHRSRAVTREDFEDLAILASPEVARSKSVPLFDLRNDPDSLFSRPGVVSVIVVPRSASSRPVPSAELLDRVRSFLNACRPAAVAADDKLVILGPEYVPIDMRLEITVTDPEIANEVELAVTLALQRFLHPLTGGPKGTGWDFGRLPQKSDIFSLIERVTGVSHVRKLQLRARFEREGIDKTAHFLVCCGQQQVVATLEE